MIDPKEQRRDREFAAFGNDALGSAAIDRLADRIAADGPRVIRRAKFVRTAVRVGPVVALILFALIWGTRPGPPPAAPALADSTRACERWSPISTSAISSGRIDLGHLGEGRSSEEARIDLRVAERCRTVLHLAQGSVAIHAKDLGGGTLIVETPQGRARVVGTIFSVSQRGEVFAVEVVEGTVEVEAHEEQILLRAGERTALAEGRLKTRAMTETEREALLIGVRDGLAQADESEALFDGAELDAPSESPETARPRVRPNRRNAERKTKVDDHAPAVSPPPTSESAEQLVARAAQLKTKAPDAARALYLRAGSMSGPTAEAAWIALARLELSRARPASAVDALNDRQRRFPSGGMVLEAAGIELEALHALGKSEAVRRLAREIVDRWPDSQQAKKAESLLDRKPR